MLRIGLQEAPSAVTAIDMDRHLTLESQPNGNLKVRFCLPLCDLTSSPNNYELGAAFSINSALNDTVVVGSTVLLNPMVMVAEAYGVTNPQMSMCVPSSPHVGLQALSFSRYRMNKLGFAYQPQGQTTQSTADTLAESRLRFCYTSDVTHPIIGSMSYRGTGTIEYSLLNETPNSVQFAEWNPWTLQIRDVPDSWLYINFPRFVPATANFGLDFQAVSRQTFFGAMSCFDSDSSSATRVLMPHGQIWMSGEVEFADPSPLLYNYIPPQITRMPSIVHNAIHGTLDEIKTTEDDVLTILPTYGESKEEKKTVFTLEELKHMLRTTDDVLPTSLRSSVVETKVNGTTKLSVTSDDDDQPEIISPPRYGTPVTQPGSSDYTPRSTPTSQKHHSKRGSIAFVKK